MAKSEKVILTTACMIYQGNQILLQNVSKGDWHGLFFPGGHVEKGESFVKAVIREIKEETGLTIKNPQLSGIKQFQAGNDERYVVLLYKTNEFSGTLTSSDEGEMEWVNRENLPNLSVAEGFFETLRVLDEASLSELYYEYGKDNDKWVDRDKWIARFF